MADRLTSRACKESSDWPSTEQPLISWISSPTCNVPDGTPQSQPTHSLTHSLTHSRKQCEIRKGTPREGHTSATPQSEFSVPHSLNIIQNMACYRGQQCDILPCSSHHVT